MDIIEKIFQDPDFDQLNNIVRWSGLNRIKDETVAHHSFFVAMSARLLAEEIFDKDDNHNKLLCTTYAIFHDFDEMFTGDIVHGVKYDSLHGEDLRDLLDKIIKNKANQKFDDNVLCERLMKSMMVDEIPVFIKKLVKVCDWLSMLFYLKKELQLGNTALIRHHNYCFKKLIDSCQDLLNMKRHYPDYNLQIILEIISKTPATFK